MKNTIKILNKQGFSPLVVLVILALLVLAGSVWYVYLQSSPTKEPSPAQTQNQTPVPVTKTPSESEIFASLKSNWQSIQTIIPFRPVYYNQKESAKKIWRAPSSVQFIGRNNVLVRFEDDNNVHIALLNFGGSDFNLLETFKNQSEFTSSDWQRLVNKYGAASYSVSTYTTDLTRNGQIISFQDLTKVQENIFVANYWQDTTVTKIRVYAINTNVPNHNGPVGCGDQAVAIERTIPPTITPLKVALELLLSWKESNLGESGLYNALALQNWKLQSVSIVNGEAIIKLSGKYIGIGVCEDPRIKAQLQMTTLQFLTVEKVSIFVDGVSLDKLMSGKGE